MVLIVPIKQVVDYRLNVRVDADGRLPLSQLKQSINPFDEIALEAALQWREAGYVDRVEVVSIGAEETTMRQALAMGADAATLFDGALDQPLHIATVLKQFIQSQSSVVGVVMGKQAIDDDAGQVGPMLAGLLDWPQATCAAQVEWSNTQQVAVWQEADIGQCQVTLSAPWLITVDLRLATPRFANVIAVMQAKNKPLVRLPLPEIDMQSMGKVSVTARQNYEAKRQQHRVNSAEALVALLQQMEVL